MQLHGTHPGIPGAVAVAVAVGDPLWAAFAVLGAGLGLTHAAEVARSHSGTIVMTSELGQGTTVTMTLRLRPPDAMLSNGRHGALTAP